MFKNLSPGAISISADMHQGIELAKNAGFDGLDLNIGEASQIAEEKSVGYVKELWEEAGLKMGTWGVPVAWNGSSQQYYESLSRLPALAELAAELGCFRTATVVSPSSNERSFQENWDFHVGRFGPAAEILRDYGHSLGLEFIGPRTSRANAKHGFVFTMDGMLGLAAAIGTGNVGLLLDTWHWYTCQSTLSDLQHLRREDVVCLHVNDAPQGIHVEDQIDNVRCMPAETGVIPLGEFFKILHQIGYDGPATVEPFNERIRQMSPADAAQATKDSLDTVWEQAGLA
ncbi:TPA: sugar phosphate isomerase/epimerase [Candidatus Poribacteria bacterium]|nr:sugar phosphate isomerase/epimerase [Candidatus Poribacteria bacterium]